MLRLRPGRRTLSARGEVGPRFLESNHTASGKNRRGGPAARRCSGLGSLGRNTRERVRLDDILVDFAGAGPKVARRFGVLLVWNVCGSGVPLGRPAPAL